MRVGLTYDLRDDYLAEGYSMEATAEFDRVDTIEGIEGALHGLGCATERIGNVRALVRRLAAGERWDLVFNIAEGMHGLGREAQVPALLEAYEIPFVFSDSLVLALALHKGLTKRVVRDAGLPTPDFAEVACAEDVACVDLPYPLFAKPVAEGTGKGITAASRISSPELLREVCLRLLDEHRQPVLVETYLPGREFTVGVVGTGRAAEAIAVLEVAYRPHADAVYSYHTKANYEDLVDYHLVDGALGEACKELSLGVWRVLGCRDGGRLDVRCDAEGRPSFIEVNPLAGMNPVISDLPILCRMAGMEYPELIRRIVRSALQRSPGVAPPPALAS
jgi:D-alanine-D-alanine ligase